MAKKTVVETYDDLTGEKIDTALVPDPTITFSIDGVDYEIELGAKNRDKFYAMFNPYIQAARKVRGNRTRRTPSSTSGPSGLTKAEIIKIRDWAQSTGRTVSARGRLPRELVEAYQQSES
jgi:hypothetical protein